MIVGFKGSDFQVSSGCIIQFDGVMDSVPSGWAFCDGNNGTPDLRNKYVKSVPDGSTDPGATGGDSSYSLTSGQLPSHNHNITVDSTDGDHSFYMESSDSGADDGNTPEIFNDNYDFLETSSTDGNHSHTINTNNSGSGNAIDNEPAYKTTNFIQRL